MKLQYFAPDLSALLGIGHINQMHAVYENGVWILRIDCDETENTYKTVKPKAKPAKPTELVKPKKPEAKPKTFMEKIFGDGKGKPNDTDWIDKFSKGPRF